MTNYSQFLPQILSNYPLTIVHHEHLRTSENVVIKLVSDSGRSYALRIRKILGSYQEQISSELVVLRDFSERTQADIPAPLPTRNGRLFCTVTAGGDAYMCIVFSWVAGVHLGAGEITPRHMAFMAQAVSLLHNFSSAYHPPSSLVRPVYDEEWFFGAPSWTTSADFVGRLDPDHAAYLRAADDTIRARLREHPRNAASFGLIHYDLHAGNFLFHENGANMIDFDECGFGYYLFDLAHILFEFIDDPRFGAFKDVVAEHYAGARYSDRDLALFLALQGIAYANWLYRIFRRDGNTDAQKYWVPKIVERLKKVAG